MIAVIVAGGKGERMGNLTQRIPKPMLPVAGKPILEHQIQVLKRYGVKDIYILIGYLGDLIANYFDDGKAFGVNIQYYSEEIPLGTSGCVKVLEDQIQDDFLVIYGDILFDMKVNDLVDFHRSKEGAATLVIHPNDHPYDSDLVLMADDERILGFLPKERKPGYYSNRVSAAVYLLSPRVFAYIPKEVPSDFVKDVFPTMLRRSEKLYGYQTGEYIKDMGTMDRLTKVSRDISSGRVHRWSKEYKRPAIFMDRDGTLISDIDLLHRADHLELFAFAASAVRKINDSDHLAFLVTNQPVVARNLCDLATVKEIHHKLETLLGQEYAYVDDLYFCPHHPDKGYPGENAEFKIDCDCRKPKIGMIRQAVEKYHVDIESSWFIGDTTTDIQTGIHAGMQTILVRTGKGGKDKKFSCRPDFVFDDLREAVDFILEEKEKYENYFKSVIADIEKGYGSDPLIISIAGLARTGKSTLTKLLIRALQKKGISVRSLSLDNWLLGVNDRTDSMTVRERFAYKQIEEDVDKLLIEGKMMLKVYDPYSRRIVDEQFFSLDGTRCLIVEGVPALDVPKLREISNIKIYMEMDEDFRKNRFYSYYRWKDLTEQEIENLYESRLRDEVSIIQESRNYADMVVRIS